MLDSAIKDQLKGLFAQLEAHYTFDIFVHPQHESRAELVDLLEEVASCSDKLSCRLQDSEGLKFILLKEGEDTGIIFRAVPGGHEFTSLLMAVLNADGKGKNFPDEFITRRIKALQGPISLTTYLSLTCTNCPDVVQALNMMVLLNGQIRHEAVDGSINEEEVERMKVQAVPTVFADGEQIHVGRSSMGDLLEKLEARYGSVELEAVETKEYDVLVGYCVNQIKTLIAGKDLEDPAAIDTWISAFTVGGGAGIIGDLLVNATDDSKYGHSAYINFMGPVIGTILSASETWDATKIGGDGGAKAWRLAKSNLPFINIWYVKAVLDHTVLNQLSEFLSPGYRKRMEKNTRKRTGQGFWRNERGIRRAPRVAKHPDPWPHPFGLFK